MVTAELNTEISVCFQCDFIFLFFPLCCKIKKDGIFPLQTRELIKKI